MKFAAVLILFGALSACVHDAGDLGRCYDGAFEAFCVVKTPPGTAIANGTGMVPAAAAVIQGTGTLINGNGAIINGSAALIKATQ